MRAPLDSRRRRLARCAAIVAVGLVTTLVWTVFWRFSSTSDGGSILADAVGFLGWTFAPCVGISAVLCLLAAPFARRLEHWPQALTFAGVSLLAPLMWGGGFGWWWDDLGFAPHAAAVAEMAWIVTLQPLWVLLLANVLVTCPVRSRPPAASARLDDARA